MGTRCRGRVQGQHPGGGRGDMVLDDLASGQPTAFVRETDK